MQSHTKSFKYGGGFLVRCPRSRGGDTLAGLFVGASNGVSTSPLVVISSCSPDEPLPPWGFALPEPVRFPEVVESDLAVADTLLLAKAVALLSPSFPPAV